jgi:hypothetical protein
MSNMFKGMGEAASSAAASQYGDSYGSGNALQKALMRLEASNAMGGGLEEDEEGNMRKKRMMTEPDDLSSFVTLQPGRGQAGNMMNLYRGLYQSYGGRQGIGGLLGE